MFLNNARFRKLSVLLVITMLATMLLSVSLVNAVEAVSGPVPEFVLVQGLGDEIFNSNYDEIAISFKEPLQNEIGQATAAIQKAVDEAFGANKAKVEILEDQDGQMFWISAQKDISLNTGKSIVIKANSIVRKDSQKSNPVDLIIYTPAPSQNPPQVDEPYILNIWNTGLCDGIMNNNNESEAFDSILFEFNQPLLNEEKSVTAAIQSAVDAAFGPKKAIVNAINLPGEETAFTGFGIEALEEIDLSNAKSIVLPPKTLTAVNGTSNSRNIYIYVQPQGQVIPQPQPQPQPQLQPQPQPQPQPQIQPVAGPAYPGFLVKYGSNGDTVKLIQDKLNNLGYNCGTVDGIFGPKTKSAVIKFQLANGLTQDGIVGPLTWGSLFGNAITVSPISTSVVYSGLVKYGMQGELVKNVQSKLLSLGYNPGPVDGIFGPKTLSAVKAYQKAKALTIDGVVGPITWKALFT